MTVAPELPPVPVARRRGSHRLRVVVDRTPAGVVALVEPPRPRGPLAPAPASVVVPAAPVEPGIGREHRPADPASPRCSDGDPVPRRVRQAPAATAVADPSRTRPLGLRPAVHSVRTRPVRTRPSGSPSAVEPVRAGPVRTRPSGSPSAVEPVRTGPVWAQPGRSRPVGIRPVGARVVRPASGHLRLTRRGRLVTAAATLLIAGLALVGVVSRAGVLHETGPLPASAPAQVVVAPGETLWSIAHRIAPDRDPRTVVAGIQHLNGLPTSDVRTGQTLLLRAP